jgi:hypothetical protein
MLPRLGAPVAGLFCLLIYVAGFISEFVARARLVVESEV